MSEAREKLLRNLLQEIATERKYDNPDIYTAAVPATGANFTSQLFHATIKTKDKEELNVFAKVAVVGETLREQAGFSMFDIEKHFYTNLIKKYKEIEYKHDFPYEHRLVVPKFYGFSNEYLKEVLVLQDLAKDGFVTYDRLKSINWNYASKAIEEMAKFHALSIAYQKEHPKDFQHTQEKLQRKMKEDNSALIEMLQNTIEKMIQMTKEESKQRLQKFFLKYMSHPQSFYNFFQPRKIPIIVHCDYRQSNLMHKIDEDGKLQVVIVDYQTLHIGNVALDLLYFIFTGSDGAFRAQYYDQLIEHYYENLVVALRRLHLDPEEVFPRTDFDEELKEMLPYGLMICGMFLPIITVDLAHVNEAGGEEFKNESFDTMANLTSNTNALCARRFNEVVEDYVKWGIL